MVPALRGVSDALGSFRLEHSGGDAGRRALRAQIRDYLVPRLLDPDSALVVAVVGGSGSGKSTLLNSVARRRISPSGPLRPTTTAPLVWSGEGLPPTLGGFPSLVAGRGLVADPAPPEGLILVDTPPPAVAGDDGRPAAIAVLEAADACVFVASGIRYADAAGWELIDVAARRHLPTLFVLNRLPAAPEIQHLLQDDFTRRLVARGVLADPGAGGVVGVAEGPDPPGERGAPAGVGERPAQGAGGPGRPARPAADGGPGGRCRGAPGGTRPGRRARRPGGRGGGRPRLVRRGGCRLPGGGRGPRRGASGRTPGGAGRRGSRSPGGGGGAALQPGGAHGGGGVGGRAGGGPSAGGPSRTVGPRGRDRRGGGAERDGLGGRSGAAGRGSLRPRLVAPPASPEAGGGPAPHDPRPLLPARAGARCAMPRSCCGRRRKPGAAWSTPGGPVLESDAARFRALVGPVPSGALLARLRLDGEAP